MTSCTQAPRLLIAPLAALLVGGPALAEPARIEPPAKAEQAEPAQPVKQAEPPAPGAVAEPSAGPPGDPPGSFDPLLGGADDSRVGRIGRVHDNIRRDRRRRSFFLEAKELYGDYARFKQRLDQQAGS